MAEHKSKLFGARNDAERGRLDGGQGRPLCGLACQAGPRQTPLTFTPAPPAAQSNDGDFDFKERPTEAQAAVEIKC